MILNQAQAEAAYSAMVALNNVGASLDATIPLSGGQLRVTELPSGRIEVYGQLSPTQVFPGREVYADQSTFATAYNLPQG